MLQLGALHPVRPHATEPENGPLRLLLQSASQAAARSTALLIPRLSHIGAIQASCLACVTMPVCVPVRVISGYGMLLGREGKRRNRGKNNRMQRCRINAFADASPRRQLTVGVEVVFHRGVAALAVCFELGRLLLWTKPASSAF